MTYEEWKEMLEEYDGRMETSHDAIDCFKDWTADREQLLAKLKEYEAFNEPLRRTYNENTAEEATP